MLMSLFLSLSLAQSPSAGGGTYLASEIGGGTHGGHGHSSTQEDFRRAAALYNSPRSYEIARKIRERREERGAWPHNTEVAEQFRTHPGALINLARRRMSAQDRITLDHLQGIRNKDCSQDAIQIVESMSEDREINETIRAVFYIIADAQPRDCATKTQVEVGDPKEAKAHGTNAVDRFYGETFPETDLKKGMADVASEPMDTILQRHAAPQKWERPPGYP